MGPSVDDDHLGPVGVEVDDRDANGGCAHVDRGDACRRH
jgi:hypothetical protein